MTNLKNSIHSMQIDDSKIISSDMRDVPVWDLLVRLFHWTLVAAFFIAYITEEDFMTLHSWAGYTIIGLLVIRIVWGFIGTKHARFGRHHYKRVGHFWH